MFKIEHSFQFDLMQYDINTKVNEQDENVLTTLKK